jgi:hypothetical protein
MNKDKVVAFQKPEQAKYFRQSCGPMMTCSWNCRKITLISGAVRRPGANCPERQHGLQCSPAATEPARSQRFEK